MAIPYVKQTWTDGVSSASAARMGVLEQGVSDISSAPCARVFHNAAQATVSGTPLVLAFNSERFDVDGLGTSTIHDTVTNNSRLTVRVAGKYQISGNIVFIGAAGGTFRQLDIRLNGTATLLAADLQNPNGVANILNVSTLYDMAVNDYVELRATQDSGGALNVSVSANYSPEFMMVRVA